MQRRRIGLLSQYDQCVRFGDSSVYITTRSVSAEEGKDGVDLTQTKAHFFCRN